jgi:NAD(P)-dependent dehydrogenase (short-subunit alcohol dehydrogenase family)
MPSEAKSKRLFITGIEALGERAHAEIVDVTDDQAVRAAVERTEQHIGAIDVVVANAGYGLEGTLEESSM